MPLFLACQPWMSFSGTPGESGGEEGDVGARHRLADAPRHAKHLFTLAAGAIMLRRPLARASLAALPVGIRRALTCTSG